MTRFFAALFMFVLVQIVRADEPNAVPPGGTADMWRNLNRI